MKFDTPAKENPIDRGKVVGRPVDRIDGPLKTTGTAPYAYERHDVAAEQAYGCIVPAGIAKGRIASLDLAAANASPGVIAIVTAETAGKLGQAKRNTAPLLGGPQIRHYHQAIALVVAEKALQQYRGTSFERPLMSALKKVSEGLPDSISLNLSEWNDSISFGKLFSKP